MKNILKKVAGIAMAVTLAFGMIGCSEPSVSNDDPVLPPAPTKEKVATPEFSVAAGEVEKGTKVVIRCATKGARIYYTMDESVPTVSSTEYIGAISIRYTVTIKAIAVKYGMDNSIVASTSYTMNIVPVPMVKITECPTRDFYISNTELTYAKWYEVYQWAAVSNGYVFQDLGREGNSGTDGAAPSENSKQPVTMVSWRDAVVWCNAASEMEGLTPVYEYKGSVLKEAENYNSQGTNKSNTTNAFPGSGKAEMATVRSDANGYRLPTEAEWEYAAKGGANFTYSGSDNINEVAWYAGNSRDVTKDVGTKTANGYELHDMSGNVWEWCWDTWVSGGTNRVYRGGSWFSYQDCCAVSSRSDDEPYYRMGDYPYYRSDTIGFRVVRNAN